MIVGEGENTHSEEEWYSFFLSEEFILPCNLSDLDGEFISVRALSESLTNC